MEITKATDINLTLVQSKDNECIHKPINGTTNEKQLKNEIHKEDSGKTLNVEEIENEREKNEKRNVLKKVTFSEEKNYREGEKENSFQKFKNEFEKEETTESWNQINFKDYYPEKMSRINQYLKKEENYYKEIKNEKASNDKFEKIEHSFHQENDKPSVFLNEEEIRKILIENEVNDLNELNYINETEELNIKDYKNVNEKKEAFAKTYESSLINYNSSSFTSILNSITNKNMNETENDLIKNTEKQNTIKIENKNYVNISENHEINKDDICIISCILCGDKIKSNTSKMCNNCLLQNIEITSVNINKDTYLIFFCRDCKRYLHNRWVYCELESKELLALCLKKVAKLKKLKIHSAKFLYTEPHSKRLKIQLSVQEEIINNFISQMDIVLHYVIKYTQCDDCKKKYTPHTYNTCVSVRQKVKHKKTLLFLENLILKNNMNEKVINIVNKPDGLDFHFNSRADGLKFCDFILGKTISKCKSSKHLITHDPKNNTYNYKYNFAIDICPICKYDLIFMDKDMASKYGIKSFFYLCIHAAVYIMLINPFSPKNNVYVSHEKYHKYPFIPCLNMADSKIFLILNVEYIKEEPIKESTLKGINMRHRKKGLAKRLRGKRYNADDADYDLTVEERKRLKHRKRIMYLEEEYNLKKLTDNEDGGKEEIEGNQEYIKNKKSSNVSEKENNSVILENSDFSDYDTLIETSIDTKSCKSSSKKLKLEKLMYAYVELYDESTGGTVLTVTYNAKHLKSGDYVHVYDLRTHFLGDEAQAVLEKNTTYNVIIIDKIKAKHKKKIVNEISVNSNNMETMKTLNEGETLTENILNRCRELENVHL